MSFIKTLKKVWHFLWKEDSLSSWVVSLIVLILFVKFIFYPVVGLVFGTNFPVVAVLSESMEHNNFFEEWWGEDGKWYSQRELAKEDFIDYRFHNGFNTGDIIFLFRVDTKKIKLGDVIVYDDYVNKYPIIHRVTNIEVDITENGNSYKYQTKGDNNFGPDPKYVEEEQILGRAFFRVPLLGWIKIWATNIFKFAIGGVIR